MSVAWRRRLSAALITLLGGLLLLSAAWAGEFDEYAVKVAYLYNFAKYVEWPPSVLVNSGDPLWICVAGDNLGDATASLAGKTIGNHPIETRSLSAAASLEKCHILFIGRTEQGRFKALLSKTGRLPILTVSDISDFAQAGGMIGLVETEQRIRFDINLTATRQVGLKLSSQLLKLATIVD